MVSTPPTPPRRPDPDDLEPDPTGIRDLLASLPDPGPMPADLVGRITASLAAEQVARSAPEVVPLRTRRTSRWKVVTAAAAAAAVVAIGVPAFLGGGGSGILASLSGGSSDDSASSAEVGAADSGSAFGAPTTPGLPTDSRDDATSRAGVGAADGSVTLRASGTAYTSEQLASQASSARSTMKDVAKPPRAMDQRGPADTSAGLRACLSGLGVPSDTVVWGDRGTFDGAPAIVAIVFAPAGQSVYAVGVDCDAGKPVALAGPVPLG